MTAWKVGDRVWVTNVGRKAVIKKVYNTEHAGLREVVDIKFDEDTSPGCFRWSPNLLVPLSAVDQLGEIV